MARLKAPERREQILAVATTLFAKHGYECATTAAIADAAGVTEPILYRHFAGKKALFIAIVRAMSNKTIQHWEKIVADTDNTYEQIRRIARQFPQQIEHLNDAYHVLHGALATSRDPEVMAVVRDHYLAKVVFFSRILRQGQSTGLIRPDIDPELIAWEIINLGIGYAMLHLNLPDLRRSADAVSMVDMILECLKTKEASGK
jgi:AcrR family transcriptional regulator